MTNPKIMVKAAEERARILALFDTKPHTTRQIADIMGCQYGYAHRYVAGLLKRELIEVAVSEVTYKGDIVYCRTGAKPELPPRRVHLINGDKDQAPAIVYHEAPKPDAMLNWVFTSGDAEPIPLDEKDRRFVAVPSPAKPVSAFPTNPWKRS